MSTRKGDWRDLLGAHSLAVDARKLWTGFIAALATILIVAAAAAAHGVIVPGSHFMYLGNLSHSSNAVLLLAGGRWAFLVRAVAPLFSPFAGGILHFLISIILYLVLLRVWTYHGGVITRLTALQYGRDELPGMSDAAAMVREKRNSYFFAPLVPLGIIVVLAVINLLIGLAGSIPYVGSVFLIAANFLAAINAGVLVFVAVLAVLGFGMMLPAISIGGKDAFEGFSSAYSYVLWGLNRFVCYTALAAVLGALTAYVASWLAQLFMGLLTGSLGLGLVGANRSIAEHAQALMGQGAPLWLPRLVDPSLGVKLAATALVLIGMCANALVAAYVFSYFFTANTIICLLMRKHVDRIEIEDIYVPAEEEEVAAPAGDAPEQQQEAEASSESAEEQSPEQEEGGEGE